jgi:hypothetical protein
VLGFVTIDLLLQEDNLMVRPTCAQDTSHVRRMGLLPS